jgi:hypothetical protein
LLRGTFALHKKKIFPEEAPMAKPTKTRAELETLIANEVRRYRHCEDFKAISIYGIVDASAAGAFNRAQSSGKVILSGLFR